MEDDDVEVVTMALEENSLIASPSRSAEFRRLKQYVEARLEEAGVRVARSVTLPYGSKKAQISNHEQVKTQERPPQTYGNYTIHGGDGLVILDIDVDDADDLPNWITSLPETFTVGTVHDGLHLYYAVEDDTDISNTKASWGSVRYDGWFTVGPGSAVDHDAECDGCGKSGRTPYNIRRDQSIATLSDDDLNNLRDVCQSEEDSTDNSTSEPDNSNPKSEFTPPDPEVADEGEEYICAEFASRHATQLAQSDLMDSLRGGDGSYNLRRDDDPDSIDRSAADYYILEWLYGAFRFRGDDPDTARELALAVFKRYCLEHKFDKTGNKRKWLQKGDPYLTGEGVDWDGQMDAVQDEFDFGAWHRWRRRQYEDGFDPDEHRPWTDPSKDGEPSDITKDTVRAAMSILVRGADPEWAGRLYGLDISPLYTSSEDSSSPSTTHSCPHCGEICTPLRACSCGDISRSNSREYPTAKEVGRLAVALNPERTQSYFEETLRQIQRETGEFARAVCNSRENSQRHVYFPYMMKPPEDADEVYCNGQEYDPDTYREHESRGEESPTLVTDGGTDFKTPSVPRPMSENGTRELDPDEPKNHPINEDMFPADPDRELVAEDREFQNAPEVTRDSHFTDAEYTIISGHRRVEKAKQEDWDTLTVEIVGPYDSPDRERTAVLRANDSRQMTPGEQVNFAEAWEEEYKSRPDLDGRVDKKACDHVEFGKSTYNKGKKVKQADEEGTWEDDEQELGMQTRATARDMWQALCDGEESIHAAHETLKAEIKSKEETEGPVAVPERTRGGISEDGVTEEELKQKGIEGSVQATIETERLTFDRALRAASLGSTFTASDEGVYVHIRVLDDGVEISMNASNGTAQNTLTLNDNYFDGVERNGKTPVGMSKRLKDIRKMLKFIEDDTGVTIEFRGQPDEEIAEGSVLTNGNLHGWLSAPDDRETFDDAPAWLPELDSDTTEEEA